MKTFKNHFLIKSLQTRARQKLYQKSNSKVIRPFLSRIRFPDFKRKISLDFLYLPLTEDSEFYPNKN